MPTKLSTFLQRQQEATKFKLNDDIKTIKQEYFDRHHFTPEETKRYTFNPRYTPTEIHDAAWKRILDEDREARILSEIARMKGELNTNSNSENNTNSDSENNTNSNSENNHSGGKSTRSKRKYKKTTRKIHRT